MPGLKIKVREPREIQRAHDLLRWALLDGDLREYLFSGDDSIGILIARANLDALCWCLEHAGEEMAFALALKRMEAAARRLGSELVDSGELHDPSELTE